MVNLFRGNEDFWFNSVLTLQIQSKLSQISSLGEVNFFAYGKYFYIKVVRNLLLPQYEVKNLLIDLACCVDVNIHFYIC